jgi:hypothetical protein
MTGIELIEEVKTMRKLFILAALTAAAIFAVLGSPAGAAPIVSHFHGSFSDSNPNANQCGIDGSSVSNGVFNGQVYADGSVKGENVFHYVFTSAATGKSIEIFGAGQSGGTATENGDGTITFVTVVKGLPEKLKIPNGPTLSRDAGNVTIIQTFDEATGDLISQSIPSESGPHPDLDSGGTVFCDVIVPALS